MSAPWGGEPRWPPFRVAEPAAIGAVPVCVQLWVFRAAAGFAPRADSVRLAMIRCGKGANIELFEYRNPQGNMDMPKAADSGASHIAFYTDDIAGAVAHLKSRGILVLGEPITMPSGDTEGETWVHFRSPWGAELELVSYPKGKGYEKTGSSRLWSPKAPAD